MIDFKTELGQKVQTLRESKGLKRVSLYQRLQQQSILLSN